MLKFPSYPFRSPEKHVGLEGEWVKSVCRADDSPSAQPFLQVDTHLALQSTSRVEPIVRQIDTLLLVSSPSSQSSSSTTVIMVFRDEEKRVKAVSEELKRQFKTLKGRERRPFDSE